MKCPKCNRELLEYAEGVYCPNTECGYIKENDL